MRWALASACALACLVSCSQGAQLRGKIAGLNGIVEQAEQNGAIRCAPRELALAKSQLEFASLELDQGFISKANAHLWKAEPNAHGFYERMGARHVRDSEPSEWGRVLSVMAVSLD